LVRLQYRLATLHCIFCRKCFPKNGWRGGVLKGGEEKGIGIAKGGGGEMLIIPAKYLERQKTPKKIAKN